LGRVVRLEVPLQPPPRDRVQAEPVLEDRLSWHSLRHSFASVLATDLELVATTLARLTGHADAGFTLRVYGRDSRDDGAVAADVSSVPPVRRSAPDLELRLP
jgi:integrase